MNVLDKKLLKAIEDGSVEIVRSLLCQGADPNAVDEYANPFIFSTLQQVSLEIRTVAKVTTILRSYYRGHDKTQYHVEFNAPVAKILLSAGAKPDVRNVSGDTPLTISAEWKDLVYAKLLLDYGADIEFTDYNGRTPLLNAVEWGNFKPETFEKQEAMIRYLVERGADINAPYRGCTALMAAVFVDRPQLVEFLLKLGADPAIVGHSNHTALDFAKEISRLVNRERIIELLS